MRVEEGQKSLKSSVSSYLGDHEVSCEARSILANDDSGCVHRRIQCSRSKTGSNGIQSPQWETNRMKPVGTPTSAESQNIHAHARSFAINKLEAKAQFLGDGRPELTRTQAKLAKLAT
ncbi:hypothetical protein A0H81_06500 [Grifola frondosa]|uniref:Uncharacterized protein n=1 Tax=Grifola frondosa TaxID=5627 RepID=A0A1C7MF28_GRIFR|nr:hypothetical protein A0H81_06500 [Grifola frondosa]